MAIIENAFNGRSMGIYVGNVLQAYSKSCSLSFKASTMDVTTKDSSLWADFLPTVKDWSISTDGLVALDSAANAVKLSDYLIAGTLVVVKFSTHTIGNLYWYGNAYVASCDISAGMDEPTSYTITLTGDGALTKARMT